MDIQIEEDLACKDFFVNTRKNVTGLFNYGHMQFELDRADDPAGEPSIAEMTQKAIEILSKNKEGFFLMVEGIGTFCLFAFTV